MHLYLYNVLRRESCIYRNTPCLSCHFLKKNFIFCEHIFHLFFYFTYIKSLKYICLQNFQKLAIQILYFPKSLVYVRWGNFGLVWQTNFLPSLSVTSFLKTLATVTSKNFSKFLNYILQNITKTNFKIF